MTWIRSVLKSTIPACPSLMYFFLKKGRLLLQKFVFGVLFHICVVTKVVDFEEFCDFMTFVRNK